MTPLHTHGEEAPAQREPLLVRVEEAARLLSLSRSMVYQLMDSGVLPSIRCGTPNTPGGSTRLGRPAAAP
jgi:excisionase family DNA binding protein